MRETVLSVRGLKTSFFTKDGLIKAVDGLDFEIGRGETLGLVGESGCGKSTVSLSVMRLISSMSGGIEEGEIIFKGKNLMALSEDEIRKIRGNDISIIFQEPDTCLNPVLTIGQQISEVLMLHQGMNKKEAFNRSVDMLSLVRLPLPRQRMTEYPHQLSGGMRQRVMIAMAVACQPEILIADEPTTALDVTIQAQILDLMNELKETLGTAIIWISHDLGVISEVSQNVLVMYSGKAVEYSDVNSIFNDPRHPYTRGLLASIPRLNHTDGKLHAIEGMAPNPYDMSKGCSFHPRCRYSRDICRNKEPEIVEYQGHRVRCFMYTHHWAKGGQ